MGCLSRTRWTRPPQLLCTLTYNGCGRPMQRKYNTVTTKHRYAVRMCGVVETKKILGDLIIFVYIIRKNLFHIPTVIIYKCVLRRTCRVWYARAFHRPNEIENARRSLLQRFVIEGWRRRRQLRVVDRAKDWCGGTGERTANMRWTLRPTPTTVEVATQSRAHTTQSIVSESTPPISV